VEKESDIAAFKDFVDTSGPIKAKPKPESKPSPPSAAPTPSAKPLTSSQQTMSKSIPTTVGIAGRIFASPLARRLAAEKGIDLSQLSGTGTGTGGRIRAQDVLSAPIIVGGGPRALEFTDIPLTSMRQTIAKRLTQSKQTIPHYYLTVEIEVDQLLE
jgi:pyruvate dehydrogenase E2 component (dihydrolipoamide acetyltransferase)